MKESAGQFVADFIFDCIQQGKNSKDAICQEAKTQIAEIDKKLHEADALRVRKNYLYQVLQHQGDETFVRKTNVVAPIDDKSEEAKVLQKKICNEIQSNSRPLTNREIIQKVASSYNEDAKVIRALKFLGENAIIARENSPERRIIRGENWEKRSAVIE